MYIWKSISIIRTYHNATEIQVALTTNAYGEIYLCFRIFHDSTKCCGGCGSFDFRMRDAYDVVLDSLLVIFVRNTETKKTPKLTCMFLLSQRQMGGSLFHFVDLRHGTI